MAGDAYVQAEDLRQAFHTNLLLLGFDQQSAEVKYKTTFNRDMFDLPNKNAFQVTAYFLFGRLDTVRCREQFRTCWPVYDKACESAFRKGCIEWLAQISKDDADSHLPRIAPSLLMSPSGEKFYALMHGFSTYVLVQVAKRELGLKSTELLHPTLTPRNLDMAEVMIKTIQCATIRHRARALEHMQTVTGVRETWHAYAAELVKEHRELAKKIRERQEDLQSLLKCRREKGLKTPGRRCAGNTGVASSRLPQYSLDADSAKRSEHAHRTRDLWKAMDAFLASVGAEKEIVESIVQEVAVSRPCLDAAEFKLAIPDLLLRRCEKELARRNVSNIYKGGKVDLLSLLHLWNLSLHLYFEKFHDGGSLDTRDAVSRLQTKAHVHTAEVKDLQALRSRLTNNVVPDLKKNIADIGKKLDALLFPEESSAPKQASIGFGMLPYTPAAARMCLQHEPAQPLSGVCDPTQAKLSLQLTPGSPEVATRVIRSAVSAGSTRPSPLAQGCPAAFSPLQQPAFSTGTGLSSLSTKPLLADGVPEVKSTLVECSAVCLPKQCAGQQRPVNRSGLKSATSLPGKSSLKHSKLPRHTAEPPAASAARKAEPPAASAARKHLARQMESGIPNRGSDAAGSQARSMGSAKPAAPKLEAASTSRLIRNSQLSTSARADAALADKIVDFVLMGSKEEEDEDRSGMDVVTSPGTELGQNVFQSRERIRRTPPRDVYARTVQQVAISDDDEEVDIITIDNLQDAPGVSNELARSGTTYGELFRTYLRDNGILRGHAMSPGDMSCANDDHAGATGGYEADTRKNVSDGSQPSQPTLTGASGRPLTSGNRETQTSSGDSSGEISTIRQGEETRSASSQDLDMKYVGDGVPLAPVAKTEHSSGRIILSEKVDFSQPGRATNESDTAAAARTRRGSQEVPGSAVNKCDGPFAATRAGDPPIGVPNTPTECGENKEDNLLDDFADDTPRAVRFIVGVPPLFPASAMMPLSLTPSPRGSSSFDSPRIVELSDDEAVAEFLKDDAAGANSSPTTDDLFKRLQALKLQAKLSDAGAIQVGNSLLSADLPLDGAQNSGNSHLFDDDASILNDSSVMSPQPSVSSPQQG